MVCPLALAICPLHAMLADASLQLAPGTGGAMPMHGARTRGSLRTKRGPAPAAWRLRGRVGAPGAGRAGAVRVTSCEEPQLSERALLSTPGSSAV